MAQQWLIRPGLLPSPQRRGPDAGWCFASSRSIKTDRQVLKPMPWIRYRVYDDHSSAYRRRVAFWLRISILLAVFLLIVTVLCAAYPYVAWGMNVLLRREGVPEVHAHISRPPALTALQALCGCIALLCGVFLAFTWPLSCRPTIPPRPGEPLTTRRPGARG